MSICLAPGKTFDLRPDGAAGARKKYRTPKYMIATAMRMEGNETVSDILGIVGC